jgi:hypothetical protein
LSARGGPLASAPLVRHHELAAPARSHHARGVGVATPAGVPFGRDQQVLAQRRQPMTANRAPVGLGKTIARWANRPPSRWRKPAHRSILAPAPRPLTALALGVGIGVAVLAVKEARRAGVGRSAERPREDLPEPRNAPAGVRAISVLQLDLAIRTLERAQRENLGKAVHDTRKAIKRARTLERLMAEATPPSHTLRRRALLREAAGELSGARDAEVALGTLESLMRRQPKRLAGSRGVARLHATLLAEQIAAERALQQSGASERALRLLSATRADIVKRSTRGGGKREAGALDVGIVRIYARGRLAMRKARKRESIAEMHEWRKRVKDLRHAAEALGEEARSKAKRDRRRARLRTLGKQADKLGEALGEEHDLALLTQRVSAEKAIFADDKRGHRALQRAIRRRRAQLRKRALNAGRALYTRKPKRFRARLPKKL